MESTWCGDVLANDISAQRYNRVSGVYAVVHRPTEARYIGQTVDLAGRRYQHMLEIRRGTHASKRMRALVEESDPADFVFVVLAVSKRRGLDDAERRCVEQAGDLCLNKASRHNARESDVLISQGRAFRHHRRAAGKSIGDVATLAGVDPVIVASVEYGLGCVDERTRAGVCRTVGYDPRTKDVFQWITEHRDEQESLLKIHRYRMAIDRIRRGMPERYRTAA